MQQGTSTFCHLIELCYALVRAYMLRNKVGLCRAMFCHLIELCYAEERAYLLRNKVGLRRAMFCHLIEYQLKPPYPALCLQPQV